jgi:hypothetical protein
MKNDEIQKENCFTVVKVVARVNVTFLHYFPKRSNSNFQGKNNSLMYSLAFFGVVSSFAKILMNFECSKEKEH